jgi:hypothetical protein
MLAPVYLRYITFRDKKMGRFIEGRARITIHNVRVRPQNQAKIPASDAILARLAICPTKMKATNYS